MDTDTAIGVVLIFIGLFVLTFIIFRSRSIIHRIADKESQTAREILKDLQHDKS